MIKKNKKLLDEWIKKNGACGFDLKNRNILLYDGGLFSIEKEKRMLPRMKGTKRLPSGSYEIIFSRKKYPSDSFYALIWMEELDETIRYFKSMKKALNKSGLRTSYKK